MNPEIKAKWVEALRSGKYQQGRMALKNGDNFCCLGVLCDLYDSSGWTPGGRFQDRGWEPPQSVRLWADFAESFKGLIKMNDEEELSFPEIADYIEANL